MSYLKKLQDIERKMEKKKEAASDNQVLTRRNDDALLSGKTAYRLWSGLLQCHIWLVADNRAKTALQADGVTEAIYTIEEAQELHRLPKVQREIVHTVKAGLNGKIETESDNQEQPQEPDRDNMVFSSDKLSSLKEAYGVDRPFTFQGRHYNPGDTVFLTEKEAEPLLRGVNSTDDNQMVDENQGNTFKYRVLKPLELPDKTTYQSGDALQATVDDVQTLIRDGSIQTACYWADKCKTNFNEWWNND